MLYDLEQAYQRNNYKIAEDILTHNPRLVDGLYCYTAVRPLGVACRDGRLDFLQLFLRAGADINEFDCDGLSALHIACADDQPDCVRILLKHDAERYDYSYCWGLTPMGAACKYNRIRCLKVLLDAKTDMSFGSCDGLTVLQVATQFGSIDCVEMLLKYGVDIHALSEDGETALQLAIETHHHQIARMIERAIEEENGY